MKAIKLMVFLCLCLLFCGCVTDREEPAWSLGTGDTLPVFSVRTSDGATVTNKTLLGKVGVIVFFNTYCADCQMELPRVQSAYNQLSNAGAVPGEVEFICIARDETEESIADFWKNNIMDMPFSPQYGREVYEKFANIGIPRIYISDKAGVIRYIHDDSSLAAVDTLMEEIESLQ